MKAEQLSDQLRELTSKYVVSLRETERVSEELTRLLLDARIDLELRSDKDFNQLFRDYTVKLETALQMANAMTAAAAKYIDNPR